METALALSTLAIAILAGWLAVSLRRAQALATDLKARLEQRDHELEESNQLLLQSSAEFQVVADTLTPVLWVTTADGLLSYYSKRWDEYTGLQFTETSGSSWQQVVYPDDLGPCLDQWAGCLKTGKPFHCEYRWRGTDGVYRWFLAQAQPVREKDGTIIKWIGTATNIDSHKRQAELLEEKVAERTRELKESERKFRAIFDHTFQLMALLEPDGRIIEVNQTALDHQGLKTEDVNGRYFWESGWFAHSEESQQQMKDAVDAVSKGQFVRFEMRLKPPSGIPSSIDFSMKPVFSQDGTVKYLIPEGRDITERKRQEEKLRELAEKLSSSNHDLQQFAYVASHDLQEPLRTVIGFCNLLNKKAGENLSPDAQKYLAVIVESVDRMQQLIKDLLLYARVETQGQPLVPVDLNKPLNDAIKGLEASIKETETKINFDKLPIVLGDANQLLRLFQNLLSNSIKFRSDKTPEIQMSVKEIGDVAELSISDNGIGISMEYAERIFEIFQRLHSLHKYPGTGIGLAVCRKIVERHGGTITLQPSSEDTKGTTFLLRLPLAAQTFEPTPEEQAGIFVIH